MTRTNKQAFSTPIMGKVIALEQYIFRVRKLPCKDLQNVEVLSLRKMCDSLFDNAILQARGKNTSPKIKDLVQSIQAKAYLIHIHKGWSTKVAAVIDSLCDEIAEHSSANCPAESQSH